MTTSEPWTSPAPEAANHTLLPLPLPLLAALAAADLPSAKRLLPTPTLTPYLVSPECTSVWSRRATQLLSTPGDAPWVTRLLVDTTTNVVVGRAGFHGAPDERGMVEVGYSVDPLHRRKGHARAALRIMMDVARGDERVRVVRASVAPGNEASRALVEGFGFVEVGEQWDEEDGLEKVLEVRVREAD